VNGENCKDLPTVKQFQAYHEIDPQCPKCGKEDARMVKRVKRSGGGLCRGDSIISCAGCEFFLKALSAVLSSRFLKFLSNTKPQPRTREAGHLVRLFAFSKTLEHLRPDGPPLNPICP